MTPHVLPRPFAYVGGRCWRTALDVALFPDFDDPSDPSRSVIMLTEDDAELGPPHTAHQIIEQDGGGAFSHWNRTLYFSTSDGSDPNTNGRKYCVSNDPARYFARRAAQAAAIVENYVRRLPEGAASFRGKRVLEIGPGRDMGTVILMAGLGAECVVAIDRFKGAWQPGWHEPFLDSLAQQAAATFGLDLSSMLNDIKVRGSFNSETISFIDGALETVRPADMGLFDVTVSHSVFEHFYSTSAAAEALRSVSKSTAVGAHHVDFRDHMNFGEPLEFLLIDDKTYNDPSVNSDYGRGNRDRLFEVIGMLKAAGFEAVSAEILTEVDDGYLDGFMPRVRTAPSRFRDFEREQFRALSAGIVWG